MISGGLGSLVSSTSSYYSASPVISLPIFDGGRNRGNLAYARASQQVALATYEKAIQTAFREVADALAQRGTIDEQIAAQSARISAARITAKLSYARYNAGIDSFLTSLDSERNYYAAQQQLFATRLTRCQNLVEIYRSLGGSFTNPLARP